MKLAHTFVPLARAGIPLARAGSPLARAGSPLARAGIGLVEVTISATILFLLAASLVEAVSQVSALERSGSIDGRLQMEAQEAVTQITEDLKAAGFVTANGKRYPYLFEDGAAELDLVAGDFTAHAHPPAVEHALAAEPDFGVNREIVFVRPTFSEVAQDSDGRNYDLFDEFGESVAVPGGVSIVKRYDFPRIDGDGDAGFEATETSFVLVTAGDGVNVLQRRRNGGSPTAVARGVERLVFDTSSTDPVGVPVGAVRVRLWMRARDGGGTVHRHFAETVVRLQNGG